MAWQWSGDQLISISADASLANGRCNEVGSLTKTSVVVTWRLTKMSWSLSAFFLKQKR